MDSIQSITNQQTAAAEQTAVQQQTSALGNETTFLQLLIAQIQNQDPTNPVDSTAFITQLAQFSSLEQLIGIRQGVTQLGTQLSSGSTSTGTTGTDTKTQN